MRNIACFLLLLLSGICGATPAHALKIVNPTETEHVSYQITYAGIPVGTVRLWWEADEHYFKITSVVKTSGVVRLFNKQKRHSELTGKREASGQFQPIMYHSTVEYPHKSRTTDMTYHQGQLREVIHSPEQTDALTLDQVEGAVDPLTAILHLLMFMREPAEAQEFYGKYIFDGKRLLLGYAFPHKETQKDCLLPCRTYVLHYKPLLGYEEDEITEAKDQSPVYLQHNPETSYFPHFLYVNATLGNVEVKRVKK